LGGASCKFTTQCVAVDNEEDGMLCARFSGENSSHLPPMLADIQSVFSAFVFFSSQVFIILSVTPSQLLSS